MNYWGVVPAAGGGTRMNSACPKQYIKIQGHCILDYCLSALLSYSKIQKVAVSLAKDAHYYWEASAYCQNSAIIICDGGATRAHSVSNALQALADYANDDDWVLVHDAVRPCLPHEEVMRLAETFQNDAVGGLLVSPVVDTIKRDDGTDCVAETLDRGHLHCALTPQMFRYRLLIDALNAALGKGHRAMDEAQAMEFVGHKVRLLKSQEINIKVTHPNDLAFAKYYLSANFSSGVANHVASDDFNDVSLSRQTRSK